VDRRQDRRLIDVKLVPRNSEVGMRKAEWFEVGIRNAEDEKKGMENSECGL